MDFENKIPEWKNEGTEPTEKLETGFTAMYKPPAAYFNWFWNKVTKCINEIQTKLKRLSLNDVADTTEKVSMTAAERTKLASIKEATTETSGLMSASDKARLDISNTIYEPPFEDRTYNVTIEGLTELYNGFEIKIKCGVTTGGNVYINVNNWGALPVVQPIVNGFYMNNNYSLKWGGLQVTAVQRFVYQGTCWVLADSPRIEEATTETSGLMSSSDKTKLDTMGYTCGTDDLTAGTSELETGKLYFVYE